MENKISFKKYLPNILLGICVCTFIVSASYLIYNLVYIPHMNNKLYDGIVESSIPIPDADDSGVWKDENIVAANPYTEEEKKSLEKNDEGVLLTFEEALKLNSDVKGWIEIPNTKINYPVLWSEAEQYYLDRDINKKKNKNGSIFMDSRNEITAENPFVKNNIIYGHNMKSGQMFADLLDYSKVSFYKKNPVIRFDTMYEPGRWVVFSVMKCSAISSDEGNFNFLRTDFSSDEDFLDYVEQIKARSLIDSKIDVNADDVLLTMQTCSYEGGSDDMRTVVVARRLRQGEDTVDVSNAVKAKDPIMPDSIK